MTHHEPGDRCHDHAERFDETWEEHDARGIYLGRVCSKCVKGFLARFRPEVLRDPGYEADEQIEPD